MVYTWFDSSLSRHPVLYAITTVKPYPDGRVRLIWESANSHALRGTSVHWSHGIEDYFLDVDNSQVPVVPIEEAREIKQPKTPGRVDSHSKRWNHPWYMRQANATNDNDHSPRRLVVAQSTMESQGQLGKSLSETTV